MQTGPIFGGPGFLFLGAWDSRPRDRALSALRHCLDAYNSDREEGVLRPHRAPVAQNGILGPENLKSRTSRPVTWRCWTNAIFHRCPTYQLHLPPKTRFGDPKSPLQGNAGKFREIQVFLSQHIAMPRKRPIQGIPGNSFWGFEMGILG